jgi:glycosyltransferase involved in cell wall biosynthesis
VEVIAEALQLLTPEENSQLEIHLTFDPKDSGYASYIAKKYPLNNLKFLGKLTREMVFAQYQISDGLLFPSKLETWGLPISEAKAMQKPIWAADLPYAKETVGDYQEVVFFDPENPIALAELFRKWLNNSPIYSGNKAPERNFPVLENWNAIFDYIRTTDAKI